MCGWHTGYLYTLCFWAFEIDTTALAHTHTRLFLLLLFLGLLCVNAKVLAPISSLHNFFFSHGARMKRNKRFRHCTYNLSSPSPRPFSPFLFCSAVIMLFIYLRRLRTISIRRSMLLLRRGKHIRSPPGFSVAFSFVWHWQSYLNVIDSVWHTNQPIEFRSPS